MMAIDVRNHRVQSGTSLNDMCVVKVRRDCKARSFGQAFSHTAICFAAICLVQFELDFFVLGMCPSLTSGSFALDFLLFSECVPA